MTARPRRPDPQGYVHVRFIVDDRDVFGAGRQFRRPSGVIGRLGYEQFSGDAGEFCLIDAQRCPFGVIALR
nr:hypothetical protein [Nocardia australiensis]